MAGAKSNNPMPRKRVEAETTSLKRARDGSAFTKCEECNKDVPVVLIDMHSCSLDSKIKMHLESQIVEKAAEPKKAAPRKRASPSEGKEKKGKKSKKADDPNKPKRPPTAFFLFMADFRKEYKEAHPDNKKVSMVAKEGGERWNLMTEEEKKPYVDRAEELKAEYGKAKENVNGGEEDEEVEEIEAKDGSDTEEETDEKKESDGKNESEEADAGKDESEKEE